ncbi:MAG: ATP-dependent DNA helicase [Gammaproteobacteria bacterium]|nr:ATP-dependent DNA helicase [Gammaproteobacteria bacterium]
MAELANELDVDAVLGVEGIIRDQIPDFCSRESQVEMARLIADSIENQQSQIIEASTGIGKSFAYMVPVFLCDKKVVISTGTKNLQDQLYFKDIPLIRKTIVNARKTALLKGRSNYCCPHRINHFKHQKQFQKPDMASLFEALSMWSLETISGDIGEFSALAENDRLWFYATSNADNCLGGDCPEFNNCFVTKARKKAMDADIVVINHHLYFSDLNLKQDGFGEILPDADVLIFDEAHQLPDVASNFYGEQLSQRQVELLCRDIIEAELAEAADSKQLQIPTDRLAKSVADFRLALGQFSQKSDWSAIQHAPALKQALTYVEDSINCLSEALEPLVSRGKDLASCFRRLQSLNQTLQHFLEPEDNQVNWYEQNDRGFRLMLSPLEISDLFRSQLDQSSFESVFFTSATLSSQQSFKYYSDRMGLGGIDESRFESPFDYQKQAILYLPDNLPDPSDNQYAKLFGECCRELITAADGHCFILFTSYRMLTWTAQYLTSKIENPLFIQGEYQRGELLHQYMESNRGVLLGTSSFWEGVDVKGDRLRCVIIDKLPFKSPGDPVYKRRLQLVNKQGGNAFMDVQIPEATISLRQGVGRLIRDINDRGIVALCDNRLNSKSYGKAMLESLPAMQLTRDIDEVKAFAEKAFSL